MQIEKPIQNWTKFPNCILDNLPKFSPTGLMVLTYMVRRCLGFQKPLTEFSQTFLMNHTGLTRNTVKKSITELLGLGSIREIGEKRSKNYMVNWSIPDRSNFDSVKNSHSELSNFDDQNCQNLTPFKETIQIKDLKDNIYTDTSFLENPPEQKKKSKKEIESEKIKAHQSFLESIPQEERSEFTDIELNEIIQYSIDNHNSTIHNWGIQKKQIQAIKKTYPKLLSEQYKKLIDAFFHVKVNDKSNFWKNTPITPKAVTIGMFDQLYEIAKQNQSGYKNKVNEPIIFMENDNDEK
jgi:hypothetical protein